MTNSLKMMMEQENDPGLILTPRISEYMMVHKDNFTHEAMERVWKELTKSGRVRSGSFSASSAGQCLRRQELSFLGKPQKPYFPNLQEVFTEGTFMHAMWQARLLSAGLIEDIEVLLEWPEKNSMGSMDGRGYVHWETINPKWRNREFILELKALRTSEKVLTPSGWIANGELNIGDKVVGSDGLATEVLGINDLGYQDFYTVSFNDGSSVDVTEQHLWEVTGWNGPRVVETKHLKTELEKNTYSGYHSIPLVLPVFHSRVDLPIAPYTLGALLGDGSFKKEGVYLHSADEQIFTNVREDGHDVTHTRYTESCPFVTIKGLLPILRDLKLDNTHSWDKFVPDIYLISAIEQRKEILAGLLDTDGTIDMYGRIKYNTASDKLKDGVVSLVRSLGGMATARLQTETGYLNQENYFVKGRPTWVVSIKLQFNPFRLERKANRYREMLTSGKGSSRRNIVSIVPTVGGEARCIKVSNENGLYVTKDYIVTHNTVGAHAWNNKADNGPSEEHLDQMHRYMLVSGIDLYVYIIIDKGNTSGLGWKEFVNEADPVRLEKSRKELDDLNEALRTETLHPLLPGCKIGQGSVYKMCPFGGKTGPCKNTNRWA